MVVGAEHPHPVLDLREGTFSHPEKIFVRA